MLVVYYAMPTEQLSQFEKGMRYQRLVGEVGQFYDELFTGVVQSAVASNGKLDSVFANNQRMRFYKTIKSALERNDADSAFTALQKFVVDLDF
ncbi:hypothetical protein SPFM1_00105 [Salmonella phage SPFM1]|nr:hypothetical protein SPFM1_00105 [Salmonella phage SPFM1]